MYLKIRRSVRGWWFIFLNTFALAVFAQNSADSPTPLCGTSVDFSSWIKFFHQKNNTSQRSNIDFYLPLKIHSVANDEGQQRAAVADIMAMICQVNENFLEAKIQFTFDGAINFIDDSDLHRHSTFQEARDLVQMHFAEDQINFFIVDQAAGAAGYYSTLSGIIVPGAPVKGFVVLDQAHLDGEVPTHELGHFLGLPHTFDGWENTIYSFDDPTPLAIGNQSVEKADGSNCHQAGDGFCDTSPDYLSFLWACADDEFSMQEQRDPDGIVFRSEGKNFMSYSDCRKEFSKEQMDAMRSYIEQFYLDILVMGMPNAFEVIGGLDVQNIFPPQESVLESNENIELSWAAVPNATHYWVTFLQLPPDFKSKDFVTSTNHWSISPKGLSDDGDFLWRVFPFNIYNTCSAFSEDFKFSKRDGFKIFPNPVGDFQKIQIEILQSQSEGKLTIFTAAGKAVFQQNFLPQNAPAKLELDLERWSPGVYFVVWQNEDYIHSEKLVKK